MSMTYHIEFDPQKVGGEFRDESLYRAALRANQCFPTLFPIESLEFLRELAISLSRRGVAFIGKADKFIDQLAADTISASHSSEAQEMLDLQLRKEQAINNSDFVLAAELYARHREMRERGVNLQLVTKERIIAALARDGVFVDNEANDVT
jgi:hypothetical protein